ncbi:uncharacterized protein PHALS_15247 [Plasmopara halstedii]|uniref:Uncharacterized protein n=1 Tax=Plasmopara halstedii TaxID=4781 RepID=A0A0P1B789_PLAHL|nr:uncharacterized protein PHALS_15247 [Plasmopara halstedii]CEG49969.1 hypothetical protein PHALS_15247 [Plasmopara halstedii]|eukprot:XP_024586338.1 hypothetical protein PHALS_15247 [Plasmopara halstedii]
MADLLMPSAYAIERFSSYTTCVDSGVLPSTNGIYRRLLFFFLQLLEWLKELKAMRMGLMETSTNFNDR